MNFSSFYVLGWLMIAVVCAWLPPKRFQPYFIALSGGVFLGWSAPLSMAILSTSSLMTYLICSQKKPQGKHISLIVSVFSVLFVYFKRGQLNGQESLAIPLGLSYYLFRQVHYAFEQYKDTLRNHSFGEFLSYLLLLPPIIVGPIHRFPAFLKDLRRRRWEWARFSLGLERAFHGYAKLIILANFLVAGYLKDVIDHYAEGTPVICGALLKSGYMWLDLYVRFSAYSDIAIGVSAMMGFTIIENFNSPFLARNISDFWSRWHISLTGWCSDYVYRPIAAMTRTPLLAITGTMLVIGLWHEFSFRYLLWGAYHASGITVFQHWRRFRNKFPDVTHPVLIRLEQWGSTGLTLFFVIASFPVTTWVQQVMVDLIRGS